MLFELLSLGSLWLLAPLFVVGIVISELLDNDKGGNASVVAVITIALLVLFSDLVESTKWLTTHTTLILSAIAAYFVLGTIWGIVKWGFWLRRTRRKVEAIIEKAKRMYGDKWEHYALGSTGWLAKEGLPYDKAPQVNEHKSKIMGWMLLWPCSVLWTLLNDPLRALFEEVYTWIKGFLQSMSNSAFQPVVASSEAFKQRTRAEQEEKEKHLNEMREIANRAVQGGRERDA